jgi:pyridoxine 5-phosphate synthase
MTQLSVNLNKIALLRNSRGREYPNVVDFAKKFIDLGVNGITVHPRQDERHITIADTHDLGQLLAGNSEVEFNVEGYPSEQFLTLVEKTRPTQCTLVPDSPEQLTSDHGWDLTQHKKTVTDICSRLSNAGIRPAIFLDPAIADVRLAAQTGTSRIELYTEAYANAYGRPQEEQVLAKYRDAAEEAQKLGLELNAGHDLDLINLQKFLSIKGILEVSIGHALMIECIDQGIESVTRQYLQICDGS